jgi:soluble cytochrome b562
MLDDKDIQKLIEVFATRDEIVTKPELKDLKEDFNNLQGSIDAYAKKADTYFQEMVMLAHKVDRHEKWLHQVAEKLGIKLDY